MADGQINAVLAEVARRCMGEKEILPLEFITSIEYDSQPDGREIVYVSGFNSELYSRDVFDRSTGEHLHSHVLYFGDSWLNLPPPEYHAYVSQMHLCIQLSNKSRPTMAYLWNYLKFLTGLSAREQDKPYSHPPTENDVLLRTLPRFFALYQQAAEHIDYRATSRFMSKVSMVR